MNVDVKCVCGRVYEVTPLIPTGDDGVSFLSTCRII